MAGFFVKEDAVFGLSRTVRRGVVEAEPLLADFAFPSVKVERRAVAAVVHDAEQLVSAVLAARVNA